MNHQASNQHIGGWLRIFLRIRTANRGWRQMLFVVIPFVGIMLWAVSLSVLLSWQWLYNGGFWPSLHTFSNVVSWTTLILLPLIVIIAGMYLLFRTAYTFVFQLHNVGTDSETEVKERIRHRFWGLNGPFSFTDYSVISSTKVEPTAEWSTWLGGPTSLIINDGFAAYLERGNRFSRVVGAGVPIPFLHARETIKAVVDLRPQVLEANVNAWTNDGIKVSMKIRVEFQITPDTSANASKGKLVYPFDGEAVRKAVEFTAVRFRDGKLEEVDWCEGTLSNITGRFAHHIASHHFDELFIRNPGGGQILSHQATHTLIENANQYLTAAAGVSIIGIQVLEITIPAEIRQQRFDVWGAKKDSLVTRIQGEAQAYRIRTNEEARARAQRDLIVAIAKSLGKVDSSHFPDEPLLMSLSGILDQGLRDPLVQTYMARGTLDALQRLKDLL